MKRQLIQFIKYDSSLAAEIKLFERNRVNKIKNTIQLLLKYRILNKENRIFFNSINQNNKVIQCLPVNSN